MSGLLIRGIRMPTEKPIAVVIHPDGTAYCAEMLAGVCTEYLNDCVAIPVPTHGRLGDLDDFAKRMKNLVEKAEDDGFDLGTVWYSTFVRHIELTPTVIPAEDGE